MPIKTLPEIYLEIRLGFLQRFLTGASGDTLKNLNSRICIVSAWISLKVSTVAHPGFALFLGMLTSTCAENYKK